MSSTEVETKDLSENHEAIVVKLITDIRSGKLEGSNKIAMATVSCLEQIIGDLENTTAFELSAAVRAAGRRVVRALPQQLAAANMVRRVLRFIRDEYSAHANLGGESAGEGLQRLVLATPARRGTLGAAGTDLRGPIRDQISELRAELEASRAAVVAQARSHVHADELLLSCGASALAERVLRAAAPRRYRLLLADGPHPPATHAMAARLSQAGVPVTVIGNECIYGVMSRVNKVVVGAAAVLAGGAALGGAGLHAATLAAQHHSVPAQREQLGARVRAAVRLRAARPHHPVHHQPRRQLPVLHLPAPLRAVRPQGLPAIAASRTGWQRAPRRGTSGAACRRDHLTLVVCFYIVGTARERTWHAFLSIDFKKRNVWIRLYFFFHVCYLRSLRIHYKHT